MHEPERLTQLIWTFARFLNGRPRNDGGQGDEREGGSFYP